MLFFKLFRKVDPSCAYCRRGTRISERDVVCLKHGVVPVEHHCRAFRYDPLKRTPPRPALLRLNGLGSEDFMLDAVPGQETLFAGMDAASWNAAEAAEALLTPEESPEAAENPDGSEETEDVEGADVPEEAAEEPAEDAEPLEEPEAVYVPEGEEPDEGDASEEVDEEPAEEPEKPDSVEKRPVKVKVRAVKIRR